MRRYLDVARPELERAESEGALFLGVLGEALGPPWITERVSAVRRGEPDREERRSHLSRHTMATLMLEGGADIR